MQHLQDNYKFWKEEEENPTHNYDLSLKGPEQNIDNATKSTENKSTITSENTDQRTSEDT